MRKMLARVVSAALLLVGCVVDQSSDEMAKNALKKIPPAPDREVSTVTHAPAPAPTLDVYTWYVRGTDERGREIVVLGRRLSKATSLRIVKVSVDLVAKEDGTEVAGPFPSNALEDSLIILTAGDLQFELPERFSRLKIEGLPRIANLRFSWKEARVPERVPELGGKTVRAILFECDVSGYESRNAAVTLFIGGLVIPHDQIRDERERLSALIYRVDRAEGGAPVMIDFGSGLRSLASERFVRPQ